MGIDVMGKKLPVEMLAILFADTRGYGRLAEPQLRSFFTDVLPAIAAHLDVRECVDANSWGDGIVAFFKDAKSAARCALAIRDYYAQADFANMGLPEELSVR